MDSIGNTNEASSGPPVIPSITFKKTLKTINIGKSVSLVDVEDAVRFFPGNSRLQLLHILHMLHVPILYFRGRNMFNLFALEKAMYYISRFGDNGFAFTGSERRREILYTSKHWGKNCPRVALDSKDVKAIRTMRVGDASEMERALDRLDQLYENRQAKKKEK